MIELPEATIIAEQIDRQLRGKRIRAAVAASSPHKFAFMTGTPEEYQGWLADRTITGSRPYGSNLIVLLDNGFELVLGGGGERILYHPSGDTVPKKHQLLLTLDDDSYLSVSVQGWGSVQVFAPDTKEAVSWPVPKGPSPLDAAFTWDYFRGLVAQLEPEDKHSVKYALISEPGVWGVGNGYLQDILFAARRHPRRRMVDVSPDELSGLHAAIVDVMRRGLIAGGRDTERDLYDQQGKYVRLMDSRTVGKPCPVCGTAIEKISFLGGACYFCSQCQS
jgi:formamidopyrimidine-DNA glycosylase